MRKIILVITCTCALLTWFLSSCQSISSSSRVNLDSSGRPTTSFQINTSKTR